MYALGLIKGGRLNQICSLEEGKTANHGNDCTGTALLTWEEMKAEQDRRKLKREASTFADGKSLFRFSSWYKA